MKHSFWNFTPRILFAPEGERSTGGGAVESTSAGADDTGDGVDSIEAAMAEMDRREQARRDEAKAKKAKAQPKADPDDDEADKDVDPRKVQKAKADKADQDKPDKKGKVSASAEDDAADDDDSAEDDSDEEASDGGDETLDGGDEDDDSDAEKRADSASLDKADTVEIEHEGEKYHVPKKLEKAFLAQAKFTQSMTELAQERHVTRNAYQVADQVVGQAQQAHQVLAQFAQAMLGEEPSPELAHSDPAAFVQQRSLYDARQKALQQIQAQGQQVAQHQQALQRQQFQQHVQSQAQALLHAAPELRDPKKREALGRDVTEAAARYGFSPQEMAQAFDHRMLLLLRDLSRLHRGEARSKQASDSVHKKLANVPPRQMKPGTATGAEGKNTRRDEARRKFAKSGRTIQDAMRVLAASD